MADDNEVRSIEQTAYTPHHISTSHTYPLHEQMPTQSYTYPWHHQDWSTAQSRENQVPPNVNLFNRYNHFADNNSSGYSNNLDAEVSYYNNFSGLAPSSYWYDENRCSSTDTSLSSASASTVFSHDSVDTDFSNDFEHSGKKRKWQTQQNKPNKKTRKETKNVPYKRWPKPPYSYRGMIAVAIHISPKQELTLQGIHAALMELFPFFRGSYTGWRDSVRHNLSHSSCFVKIPSEHPVKAGLWTVDWTQVSPAIFNRQQSKVPGSDKYKATIHEHLGLEPYHNETYTENSHPDDFDIRKTPLQQKANNSKDRTPQMSDTQKFSVNLPEVEKCESSKDSPCQMRDQSQVKPLPADDSDRFQITSTATAPHSESYHPLFGNFLDIIMESRRSSFDAAHHLQSLCAPVAPLTPTDIVLPPHPRDSDVYTHISPVNSAFENLSENKSSAVENASDASFVQEYTIMSPCKTLMTSFLDSGRHEAVRERNEHGASREDKEEVIEAAKE